MNNIDYQLKDKKIKIKQLLTILVLLIVLFLLPDKSTLAADINNPAKLFELNCAGCHPHGGNIIRRGKNLKTRALHRNKLDSVEAIASLVAQGKNNMPAYQERLTEKEIQDVSAYLLEQAEKGWR